MNSFIVDMLLDVCGYGFRKEQSSCSHQLFLSTFLLLLQSLFAYFIAELGKGLSFSVLLLHYIWVHGSVLFPPVANHTYCLETCTPQV